MYDEAVIKYNSILVFNENRMPINKTNNYHPDLMIMRDESSLKALIRTTKGRIRTLKNKRTIYKKEIYAYEKFEDELFNYKENKKIVKCYKNEIKKIGLDIHEYIISIKVLENKLNN